VDDVHTPGFLNAIVASGLPNHKLRLKVGVPMMLLRNIGVWDCATELGWPLQEWVCLCLKDKSYRALT
jgi:hypothetical protein